MRPEEYFGLDAGRVWKALKDSTRPLSAREIAKATGLKITRVYSALGWLGREGKIEIMKNDKGRKVLFRLLE
ncbi:MAG: winged helix-turn-helix domain-containing protein [Thermoprotei archaeon]|nr:winged helix-turn-helix domain-containing protein [Thermoprotei archaeon]